MIHLASPDHTETASSTRRIRIAAGLFLPILCFLVLEPLRVEAIPTPGGGFVHRKITVIPYGADSSSFPAAGPCNDPCVPAFGFTGPDGSIYIYDHERRNLKHVTLSSEGVSVAVIPGPEITNSFFENPRLGAAGKEGTLYLLSHSGERFHLYARAPGGQWTKERLSVTAVGAIWPSDPQGHPRHPGGARISAEGDSELVFFAVDRRRHPATTIAVRGHMIAESNRRILPVGVPVEVDGKEVARLVGDSIERPDGTTTSFPFKTAMFLGIDRQGRSYYIVDRPAPAPSPPSNTVYYIEAYDASGNLLARVSRPHGEERRHVGNGFLVTPSGGIIVLRFTKKGLAVSQLIVEEQR